MHQATAGMVATMARQKRVSGSASIRGGVWGTAARVRHWGRRILAGV
jgi:hypothetical protein